MDFLIGFLVMGLPVLLVFFALAKYRKDWVGIWRGRKIHIVRTLGQCLLYVDDQEICRKSLWKRHINHQWNDRIHGSVNILLSMQTDSSGGIGSYQLLIDGEIVHLAQAPTDWAGNTIKTEIPTLKDTAVVEGTQISDPRYAAAERLLNTITTELGEDKESLSLIQGLHTELKEHILIAERLLQSKADYASLGNDGGDMELIEITGHWLPVVFGVLLVVSVLYFLALLYSLFIFILRLY